MKVLILAGGFGTRIRPLFPELPKSLVPVAGRPFLEWQIELLASQGFDEIVLCLGYRASQIAEHFQDGSSWNARIKYSLESEPLGTGGALRQAAQHLESTVLVVNGDTYLRADYAALAARHRVLVATAAAQASLCLVEVEDASRYGRVLMHSDGRVTGFEEKPPTPVAGQVNAGAYFIEPPVLEAIPSGRAVSLEREVFPALARDHRLFGLPAPGPFVDMGTPDGHSRMESMLEASTCVDAAVGSRRLACDWAVFLDRDGVIVEEVGYLFRPDQLRLIPSAARGIELLNQRGVPAIVVTNQAGVARGYYPEARVAEVHAALQSLLGAEHARIDSFLYCPHHPTEGIDPYPIDCDCRKPRPGLLRRAAEASGLNLTRSFMIGDKPSDVGAGRNAGCTTILVLTGYGAEEWRRWSEPYRPDHVATDLLDAVRWILARS